MSFLAKVKAHHNKSRTTNRTVVPEWDVEICMDLPIDVATLRNIEAFGRQQNSDTAMMAKLAQLKWYVESENGVKQPFIKLSELDAFQAHIDVELMNRVSVELGMKEENPETGEIDYTADAMPALAAVEAAAKNA